MFTNYKLRKAAKPFAVETDFSRARGYVHERHVAEQATKKSVDASALEATIKASGLVVAYKWIVKYKYGAEYREVSLSAPTSEQAIEIAERRLSEQYGDGVFDHEAREREKYSNPDLETQEAKLLRARPELHQDYYTFDSVRRG